MRYNIWYFTASFLPDVFNSHFAIMKAQVDLSWIEWDIVDRYFICRILWYWWCITWGDRYGLEVSQWRNLFFVEYHLHEYGGEGTESFGIEKFVRRWNYNINLKCRCRWRWDFMTHTCMLLLNFFFLLTSFIIFGDLGMFLLGLHSLLLRNLLWSLFVVESAIEENPFFEKKRSLYPNQWV